MAPTFDASTPLGGNRDFAGSSSSKFSTSKRCTIKSIRHTISNSIRYRYSVVGRVHMMDTNSQTSDEDEPIKRPSTLNWRCIVTQLYNSFSSDYFYTRLRLIGVVPTILCKELKAARRGSPLALRVEDSLRFWDKFLNSFTQGDLVLLARAVFHDLCEMPDDEAAKFKEYEMLETNLELTEQMINDVYCHALDDDPAGRKWSMSLRENPR